MNANGPSNNSWFVSIFGRQDTNGQVSDIFDVNPPFNAWSTQNVNGRSGSGGGIRHWNLPAGPITIRWSGRETITRLECFSLVQEMACTPTFTPTSTFTSTPTITPTPTPTFSCCYQLEFSWGIQGTGDGQFTNPWGITVDHTNNCNSGPCVYVTDQSNHRIQKFDASGNFIGKWGVQGPGDGQFFFPYGIAVNSSSSSIYVADTNNNRIQVFDTNGNFLTKWGSPGIGNGQFQGGVAVDIDSNGFVYVADWINNSIQKFTSGGVFQLRWGGAGNGNGLFDQPFGVATDLFGNVYVSDIASNNLVQKFNAVSGAFILQWGGFGALPGQFQVPYQLTTDLSGNIYVADSFNNRVQKFDPNGNFLCLFNTTGRPTDVSVDSAGKIYVVEYFDNIIEKFGTCTTSMSVAAANAVNKKSAVNTVASTINPAMSATPSSGFAIDSNVLVESVQAAPNVVRDGQLVKIRFISGHATKVQLSIFTLTGESVHETAAGGNAGLNELVWKVENQAGQSVASGLYIYVLRVDDGQNRDTIKGKIVVIR